MGCAFVLRVPARNAGRAQSYVNTILDGDYFQVGVSLAWIKLNQYCNMGHYTGKRPLWHTVVRGNELMHAVV